MYKNTVLWLQFIVLSYIKLCSSQQLYLSQDQTCRLENTQFGTCKPLSECLPAMSELEILKKHPIICSFQGIHPVVCCPTTTNPIPTNPIPTNPFPINPIETLTNSRPATDQVAQKISYIPGDSCRLKNGNAGTCESLEDCDFQTKTIYSSDWNWCDDLERSTFICCHQKKPKHYLACKDYKYAFGDKTTLDIVEVIYNITYDDSGFVSAVGGDPAEYGEFPHMALIGFGTEDNKVWSCGGTLLSNNFVLTAAHCLFLQDVGDARFVRLGELDLSSQNSTIKAEDYNVIESFRHPGYNPPQMYNDIALLKLDRNVTFTDFIHPACLYDKYTVPYSKLNATGWGATEYLGDFNNQLLKVELSLFTFEECFPFYNSQTNRRILPYGIDNSTHICSGGRDQMKDTCQGDSGGPLQLKNGTDVHYVVGVTSFGKACAIGSSPGVYTRVSPFIPWIESIVWG